MPKHRKPLTDREKWNNLGKALAEDALKDENPPEISDAEVKKVREKIREAVEKNSYVARMETKLAKEAQRKKGKYIN